MKDLLKPGRPLKEYIEEDGTLKVYCRTCLHRHSITAKLIGDYLCIGGQEGWNNCTNKGKGWGDKNYKFWEPRVDVNNHFKEEDFAL